jgi:hypothetical protein
MKSPLSYEKMIKGIRANRSWASKRYALGKRSRAPKAQLIRVIPKVEAMIIPFQND